MHPLCRTPVFLTGHGNFGQSPICPTQIALPEIRSVLFQLWFGQSRSEGDPMTKLRSVVTQDGAAILDSQQGIISTLNATGVFIWQALERGESPEEVVSALARETNTTPETIEPDVLAFIRDLKERRLHP